MCKHSSCNDNRSSKQCNEPYRFKCDGKVLLNLSAPTCVLKDSVQRKLYKTLYRNIVKNNLEEKLNILVGLPRGSPEQASFYFELLSELLLAFKINLGTDSPRLLVAESDGRVIYDTGSADRNTPENFNTGTVNENHNTRPEMMAAQLFECGVGHNVRISNSVGAFQSYVAVRAGRYLNLSNTIRLSVVP